MKRSLILVIFIVILAIVGFLVYFINLKTTPTTTILISPNNAIIGGFNVTVKEAFYVKSLDNRYNSSYENGSFLLVTLSVCNIEKSPRLFGILGEYFGFEGTVEVALIDDRGYEYYSFNRVPLPTTTIKWYVLPQRIDPQLCKEITIAFDIPSNAKGLRLGLRAEKTSEWTLLEIPFK